MNTKPRKSCAKNCTWGREMFPNRTHCPVCGGEMKLVVAPVPPGEKKCNECSELKPLTEYGKCQRNKDGHQNKCKECDRARARERYHSKPTSKGKRYKLRKAKRRKTRSNENKS